MELRWWPFAVVAALLLVAGGAAAWLMPVQRMQRQLRPLAHVDRLTRLPEFARVHRVYLVSMAVTASLLLVALIASVTAAARPQHLAADNVGYEAAHPLDVMLCIGQPVTDPTTADMLRFYAERAGSFTSQQIGVTSTDLRAMPMTRDRTYAEQRLRYFADLAQIQQEIDTGGDVSVDARLELARGIEAFARPVEYVDYAPTLEDVLALCITGFPKSDVPSDHRRQLVYLGYSQLRSVDDKRPSLYDKNQVKAMAQRGGIQLNAISRADVAQNSQPGNDALRDLTDSTGGLFTLYNPAGTATTDGGTGRVLETDLDDIAANTPPAAVVGESTTRHLDFPQTALSVALVSVLLLSVSLLGLRR
ncbi:hypothetical protein ACQI4L_27445 [Mycolicibacterium litorale]|uniref:hypothetical protein n=1 Tax=Mycolicibacterium litorale TaxID=758802 RepID=UPI003CF0389F